MRVRNYLKLKCSYPKSPLYLFANISELESYVILYMISRAIYAKCYISHIQIIYRKRQLMQLSLSGFIKYSSKLDDANKFYLCIEYTLYYFTRII